MLKFLTKSFVRASIILKLFKSKHRISNPYSFFRKSISEMYKNNLFIDNKLKSKN